jgi:hypothetical protein
MKTREELTQDILACRSKRVKTGKRIGKRYGWRDVARELYPLLEPNATSSLLNKLYRHPEYLPGREVCERLHLVFYQPRPVCQKHGIVHDYDCETYELKKKARASRGSHPRPSYKQLYRRTIALLVVVLSRNVSTETESEA